LRTGLFRSPETLAALRCEATDRFLRWREVERAVGEIHSGRQERQGAYTGKAPKWSKAEWEAEWDVNLSQDVARRLHEDTSTAQDGPFGEPRSGWVGNPAYDPLHLPSLFVFSMSLFGPLTGRIARSIEEFLEKLKLRDYHVGLALVGGFCMGIGFSMFIR
jgi:hypothetical protein